MRGIKHLIECHCMLPQYRKTKDPLFHKFVVFSKIDDSDTVEEKIAQCNNCGIIHKVYDICKSEILGGKEESFSIVTISDLRESFSDRIVSVLENNNCDVSVWEHVDFILSNCLWNETVVLRRDIIEGKTHIKILKILDENRIKIENHIIKDFVG